MLLLKFESKQEGKDRYVECSTFDVGYGDFDNLYVVTTDFFGRKEAAIELTISRDGAKVGEYKEDVYEKCYVMQAGETVHTIYAPTPDAAQGSGHSA